jgi:hypothetical protein
MHREYAGAAAALTMDSFAQTGWRGPLLSFALFLAHQVAATFGVAIFAYLLGISVFDIVAIFTNAHSMRPLHYILTETPYFPVQIALGFWSGWSLGKRVQHKAMIYVWAIPLLILTYAFFSIRSISPGFSSVLTHEPSRFSHYFGWGCQPKDRCLDQIMVTMPFYAASAYSLGAWLAFKKRHASPQNNPTSSESNY